MISEASIQIPVSAPQPVGPAGAFDADSEARWAAWVARGRVHEQRVRRRFVVWTGVLALGAALAYAIVRVL